VNAPAGQVGEYKYSKALRAAAANGLHWTPEALDLVLKKPKAFLPKTKMSFRGLKKPSDRTDVIAYLATFSTVETAAKPDAGFEISADILSIAGDIEYGEYLSSECTTCHQMNGASDAIPNITGWPADDFVTAMHAYREKYRSHPVMQMISGRLSNDEIAALAAYYSSLKK
jgi:cytochrome c